MCVFQAISDWNARHQSLFSRNVRWILDASSTLALELILTNSAPHVSALFLEEIPRRNRNQYDCDKPKRRTAHSSFLAIRRF